MSLACRAVGLRIKETPTDFWLRSHLSLSHRHSAQLSPAPPAPDLRANTAGASSRRAPPPTSCRPWHPKGSFSARAFNERMAAVRPPRMSLERRRMSTVTARSAPTWITVVAAAGVAGRQTTGDSRQPRDVPLGWGRAAGRGRRAGWVRVRRCGADRCRHWRPTMRRRRYPRAERDKQSRQILERIGR